MSSVWERGEQTFDQQVKAARRGGQKALRRRAKAPSKLWAVIFANTGNVFQVCTQKYRAEHIARTREDKEMRVVEYAAKGQS